jgi:hypothetical protein
MGELADSTLTARKIGQSQRRVIGAPAYFETIGVPQTPAAYAGSRLKLPMIREGTAWKASLPAVLGENPPYGMIGRVEETSASFEARSAPRSYPTSISGHWPDLIYKSHRRRGRPVLCCGQSGADGFASD